MTPRRTIIAAAIVIILAVSLLYDAPTSPPSEPTPTPDINCDYHYERRGLGWEPWEIVYDCE